MAALGYLGLKYNARERSAFGRSLSTHRAIRHKPVDVATTITPAAA